MANPAVPGPLSNATKTSAWRRALRVFGQQTWIRRGVKYRILRAFHEPSNAKSEKFECPFYGLVYSGDFANSIDWWVFYHGTYELQEIELMQDVLAGVSNAVAFDVGANIGHHTLFLSGVCSKVYSFEPFEPVRSVLESRLRQNSLKNVEVLPFGLGDHDDSLPFVSIEGNNEGLGSFVFAPFIPIIDQMLADDGVKQGITANQVYERLRDQHGYEGGDTQVLVYVGQVRAKQKEAGAVSADAAQVTQKLEVRSADSYAASAGIDRVDFVKIDTEGFEVNVLKGMCKLIQRCQPVVLFEWASAGRSGENSIETLLPGYDILKLARPYPRALFFAERGYRLEPIGDSGFGNYVAFPPGYLKSRKGKFPERLRKALGRN